MDYQEIVDTPGNQRHFADLRFIKDLRLPYQNPTTWTALCGEVGRTRAEDAKARQRSRGRRINSYSAIAWCEHCARMAGIELTRSHRKYTPVDTDTLAKLAAGATDQTWRYRPDKPKGTPGTGLYWPVFSEGGKTLVHVMDEDNAAFVAAATPDVILNMVAELEEARAELAELRETIQRQESA